MIPAKVEFDGFEFDPRDVIVGRKLRGPIPSHWLRVRFGVENVGPNVLVKVDRWIAKNCHDRWASYSVPHSNSKRTVVLAFESDTEAVMFRLKGGETAWNEADQDTGF